ncbi:hypothetical protein CVT25_005684 [Psilocybe cyanescens]|uniref:Uncharacterized protein n=1 Tax=Psilocybe cyanescens TaxID=93625 RepID=A0A409VLH6_PSICY|nr:hypothetical protein CVT25_005684 [Psilocybe cyanescens]
MVLFNAKLCGGLIRNGTNRSREKTDTKPAHNSPQQHAPEANSKGLNCSADGKYHSTNEERSFTTDSITDPTSSDGGD